LCEDDVILTKMMSELYFEESTKENMITKCKVINGNNENEILFCMIYSS